MGTVRVDAGLWCRRFHPSPQAVSRLVCFPHAGGSAAFFHPVSARLAGRTDVVAVQYPGRQDRRLEPCLDDIHELADRLHEVLREQTDLPLTFFGHSMGASVAFEVARRLERDGQSLARVFVSGRRAPSRPRDDEQVHLRDDDGIVAEMKTLSGTDPAVFADEEILRMVLPALRADYRAAETYRTEPGAALVSPVTALTGDDDPRTSIDDARAWQDHTSGDFQLKVFPGGHFYLSDRPGDVLNVLADHLDGLRTPS
ncbi:MULTISPECIES: thioesterase II family protein [Kitasatospora]|uniref:thioesterase II family protein n=1 Tax=Kitasatospora TaxID=2063 RepID=UPI000CBD628F|nr:alpha/beta fold hydrolase [Kitasatospora sp. GP30]MDH6145475.1 surfactin synthase thioesterase subunit [Kitasatospora sp. GP30]